jgi:hypothetical protein
MSSSTVTACSLLLPVRVALVEAAAVVVVSSVVRDVVVVVNPVAAKDAAVARAVAISAADAVVVRVDVVAAKLVDAADVVETSPAPTSPTPARSLAWAHSSAIRRLRTRLEQPCRKAIVCRWTGNAINQPNR